MATKWLRPQTQFWCKKLCKELKEHTKLYEYCLCLQFCWGKHKNLQLKQVIQ
jgi:hypothetical protein